jgi:hypothetical protein
MLVAVTLPLHRASSASCVGCIAAKAMLRKGIPVVEGRRGGSHAAGASCAFECIAVKATLREDIPVAEVGRRDCWQSRCGCSVRRVHCIRGNTPGELPSGRSREVRILRVRSGGDDTVPQDHVASQAIS